MPTNFLIVALFAAMLALGASILPYHVARLSANNGLETWRARGTVNNDGLERIRTSRLRALAWMTRAESLNDLAESELERAHFCPIQSCVERRWRNARMMTEQALQRAPADPTAHTRRAWILYHQGNMDALAAQALRASLQTGSNEPRLNLSRLLLMWDMRDRLPADLSETMPRLAQQSRRDKPWMFDQAARAANLPADWISVP